ncbi:MAG: hypothetical protein ACRDJN_14025, partial [Chloroflexota bacterium]
IYTARCVGALLRLAQRTGEDRYRAAAVAAGRFLVRQVTPRGSRFGYYRDGRPVAAPEWISPSGDVLRALIGLSPELDGARPAAETLALTLVRAQYPTGGLPTAYGFASRGSTREWRGRPELRDALPVAGWCDKTWRALALLSSGRPAPSDGAAGEMGVAEVACTWRGQACVFREDGETMRLLHQPTGKEIYRWQKGSVSPDVCAL